MCCIIVCGFEYKNAVDGSGSETRAFPIVGHESKNPEITRLKKADPDREGLSVRLWGGQYIDDDKAKKDAGAEIEFQCDPTRSGLEGLETIEDPAVNTKDAGDYSNGDQLRSLQFKSFGPSDNNTYLLKLDWKTRYACDDYLSGKKGSSSSSHWGFFTWFIVMYVFPLSVSSFPWRILTSQLLQPLPLHRCLPRFRLLAQLQPLRCPWVGSPPARRHNPRRAVYLPGLVPTSSQHPSRVGIEGWL